MRDDMHNPNQLQVTLVSGLPGAGRSSVVRALSGKAPVSSFDAAVVGAGDPSATSEHVLDLADALFAEARSGRSGSVVVELPHQADTTHVGLLLEELFECEPDSEPAPRLRNLVTVTSVSDIHRLLFRVGDQLAEFDTAEQLATQLEFATTIVLSGIAITPTEDIREARALISRLNPWANVVSMETVMRSPGRCASNRVRPARGLAENAGWMLELSGRGPLPTTTDGIGVVVFRDPRPFHPGRLAEALASGFDPDEAGLLLRSRGLIQLASRPHVVGTWASAGEVLSLGPTSMASWDAESPLGQEIVFFGRDLDVEHVTQVLSASLLTGSEIVAGSAEWVTYEDPFPVWNLEHDH